MKSAQEKLTRLEPYLPLALISLIGLLCYAPLIYRLGYYREDWIVIWAGVTQGPKFLIPMYEGERLLEGYSFSILYQVLGNSPLPWHLYALGVRLLGAFAFFWILRMTWPKEKFVTTMATLLFVTYPGFLQQPQANCFQHHLVALALALFSVALTVYSIKTKNLAIILLTNALALFFIPIYPLIMEYYIGLEGVRAIFLWYGLRQGTPLSISQDLKRFFFRFLPYLIVLGAFIFWRINIFQSTRPTTSFNRLYATYLVGGPHMIYRFLIELARDIAETVITVWTVPFNNYLYWGSYNDSLRTFLLSLITILLVIAYYLIFRQGEKSKNLSFKTTSNGKSMIWIGGLSVIATLIPVIISNQEIRFEPFSRLDRFSLPVSVGVVLVVCGLISIAIKPRYRIWMVSLLIGMATFSHINHALYMGDYWTIQRQLWWQLSWRVPQLKEKTLLVVNLPAYFRYVGEADIWAPANIIYYPQPGPPAITAEVFVQQTAFEIQKGVEKPRIFRNVLVNKEFDNTLILSMPTIKSCLNVIDGIKYELSQEEDPLVRSVASYSKIDRIDTISPFIQPPTDIFGPEPERSWCYYYQKAAYARQIGDWEQISRLGDEAQSKGFSPGDPSEWMPFLEGYASVGRDKDAKKLAINIKSDPDVKFSICNQLSVPPPYLGSYDYEKVVSLLCQAGG